MPSRIQQYDIGLAFKALIKDEADSVVNLTAATVKQLMFRKPDGTLMTKDAAFSTDGSDGYIQYVTATSGDLNVAGMYRLQARIYIPGSGNLFRTDVAEAFKVYENLD